MKYTKTQHILSITVAFSILISYCSFDNYQISGGTTTETTNGYITGTLEKIDGTPARQTIVKLIESNYDPINDGPIPDSLIDTTGEVGEFAFHVAGGRTFNIEGVQRSSGEGILISGVIVKDSDTTTTPSGTIRKMGSIKILFPAKIDTADAYVYIRGTSICTMLDDTSGFILLESVPVGTIPSVYYSVKSSSIGPQTIADSVSVASGVTTVIMYQMGAHSAKLFLNTTASGAGISGTVTNFPVLIRLREGNFDFAEAKTDGGDLRFTKSNGAPLPYEIERWDPAVRQAEVWVKVDTVYGNDSTNFIKMFWGGSTAASESNGAAIFDTTTGFQGVWHLDENGDNSNDATCNAFNGINSGVTPIEGIIGNAKYFSNGSNIQIPGLLNSPSSITLSAWVSAGPTDPAQNGNLSQEIVSIGDAVLIRLDNATGIGTCGSYHNSVIAVGQDTSFAITGSGRHLANTGWHYIAFSINSATHVQTLYIDGEQCAIAHDVNPIAYDGLGNNTFIGIHGNGLKTSNVNGVIDEVRINKTALTSDWVKLCYMNQKKDDVLVKWK